MKQNQTKIYNKYTIKVVTQDKEMAKLVTIDFLRLNTILHNMVVNGQLTNEEREALLHRSGLLKLTDTCWREDENSTLTFPFPKVETF